MSFPLFAETYQINGRNYRRPAYRSNKTVSKQQQFQDTPDVYEDEPAVSCFVKDVPLKKKCQEAATEIADTEDERVKCVNGNKWIAKVTVPNVFMGIFIGPYRRTLKELEDATRCRIKTPRRDQPAPCEISSIESLECVQRCLDRIDIFIADAKQNASVTHFVALPCNQQDVIDCFDSFRNEVLTNPNFDESAKNEKLFTKVSRLHLTIAVGWIFDDDDLEKVKEAFGEIESQVKNILNGNPLIADIHGIDIMNDDPANINILYAKVGGEHIQRIANTIRNILVQNGIGKKEEDDNVKLHMTLMNSRYVAQESGKKRKQFNATQILEELKEFYFGTIVIPEICLCPLNSTKENSGFYEKLVIIKL